MYETLLFVNIFNTKKIVKIGSNEVNIKTHGQERIYVTEIIWYAVYGTKYPNVNV